MRRAIIDADEETERLDIDINTQTGPYLLTVELGDEQVYVHRKDMPDPAGNRGHTVELPITERTVNQHTYFEVDSRSHSNSASSSTHKDHVDFLAQDGDDWIYFVPHVTNPYAAERSDSNYKPTNVPGVEITTVFQRSNQTESASRKRIRVNREAVDQFDELYALCYRIEKGGNRDGSYHRVKNTEATKLLPEDDS